MPFNPGSNNTFSLKAAQQDDEIPEQKVVKLALFVLPRAALVQLDGSL